jgi:DNA-binding NtrC family response regulator
MAMLVMSPERRRWLEPNLELLNVQVLRAGSCQEARLLLKNNPPVSVVITDVSLSDGNWCDIFRYLVDNGFYASVVVSSRLADERLWSEVLWRGAYDVLVEPYEATEVRRIMEGALRAATTRSGSVAAAASASMN